METIDLEFVEELEAAAGSKVELGWLAANSGLVEKMRMLAEECDANRSDNDYCYKYNNSEELDYLLETKRDSEAMKDPNAKRFLINNVINEFQPNMNRLNATTIDRMLQRFCSSDFEGIEKDGGVYAFLMDCLEQKPPLNSDMRWFWMCIVTSKHGDSFDDGHVRENVDEFSKRCNARFLSTSRPFEYKLFLLTLLENDYAATVARQQLRCERITIRQSNTNKGISSAAERRNVPLNTMEDVSTLPLAYLLLCKLNKEVGTFSEYGKTELERCLLDILLLFMPNDQPVHVARLYARLIGLLLDVLLFIELAFDKHPFDQLTELNTIPDKLRNLVRKVHAQNDDWEWQFFVDSAGAPWIRELVNAPDFRKTYFQPPARIFANKKDQSK